MPEVKMLASAFLALLLLFYTVVSTQMLRAVPNPDELAGDFLILHEALEVADKYAVEVLSYAFYEELNEVARTNIAPQYRNQPNERWNVPDWFITPAEDPAQYDGLGDTIWNLTGGTSQNDPCPDVVSYTLNPSADIFLTAADPTEVRTRVLALWASAEANIVRALEHTGRNINITYSNTSVTRSTINNTVRWRITARTRVDVNRAFTFSVQNPTLSKTIDTNIDMFTSLISVPVQGFCICENASTGDKIVLKTYDLQRVYLQIIAYNNEINVSNTQEKRVFDGRLRLLQYFVDVNQDRTDTRFSYNDCEMVIP